MILSQSGNNMKKSRNSKKSKILTAALVAGALLPHSVIADDKEIEKITGSLTIFMLSL